MTTVVPVRHRRQRRRHPRPPPALPRAGPEGRRVRAHPGDPRPPPHRRRAGDVRGHVERALLVQVVQGAPGLLRRDDHADEMRERMLAGHRRERGRRRRSATAGPSRSRSSRTTTRPTSSPTRARPPGSAASCATSWRWARGRSPSPTRCASAPPTRPTRAGCCPASSRASAATATRSACPTSAARSSSTPPTRATRWSTPCASGALRAEDLHLAFASGAGNKIILFGARTGLDGIGGVSVLASETFDGDGSGGGRKKLPRVQVGDPFTEKVLIECCLELIDAGLVVGIQDLGGAGLSCATSELASAGDGGMHIDLDAVPLRATGMTPAEILSSESQERMCAVVRPGQRRRVPGGLQRWDVLATVIGEVTDGDRLVITWRGETVVDVPPRTVAHDGPVYRAPGGPLRAARTRWSPTSPTPCPRPAAPSELRAEILRMAASPEPRQPRLGHRPVRPLRPRQHRQRPARRRRDDPDRRGDRPRGRRRHRLQRPLRRARPLRGHPARARRGVPQRGDHRGRAGRRHQLPQLRLAGGPARHVAVPGGRARARRRLRAPRHPGHRRQRQLLQPDRRPRRSCRRRWSACSA